MRGCEQYDSKTLIVGGGFSANSQLRAKLLEYGERAGVEVRIPRLKLCTDNGAMVAMLGVNLVEAGEAPSAPDCPIDSAMPMTKSACSPSARPVAAGHPHLQGPESCREATGGGHPQQCGG